jgi:hypothetical protein
MLLCRLKQRRSIWQSTKLARLLRNRDINLSSNHRHVHGRAYLAALRERIRYDGDPDFLVDRANTSRDCCECSYFSAIVVPSVPRAIAIAACAIIIVITPPLIATYLPIVSTVQIRETGGNSHTRT